MNNIALISMPWAPVTRPSIQLAALKGWINNSLPEINIECMHLYLDIANYLGADKYFECSVDNQWYGDALYSYILFPDMQKKIEYFISHILKEDEANFKNNAAAIKKMHDEYHISLNWDKYDLIGFSISMGQLPASLYMIMQIKAKFPSARIIVGGCECCEDLGYSLLKCFKEIDIVVNGEGEKPFENILKNIHRNDLLADIKGIIYRNNANELTNNGIDQIENINALPIPDFSDYFFQFYEKKTIKTKQPVISYEASRGCWQQYRKKSTYSGCTFCNLNLQWRKYRAKHPDKIVKEIDYLVEKYKILNTEFVDNVLPQNKNVLSGIFNGIKNNNRNLQITLELYPALSKEKLKILHDSGVKTVQYGFESFDNNILAILNKGTNIITIIQQIKYCTELNIDISQSNIITHIPGVREENLKNLIKTLDFIIPNFFPIRLSRFNLFYGTPMAKCPEEFEITNLRNHDWYQYIFPENNLADFVGTRMSFSYIDNQISYLWKKVIDIFTAWQQMYVGLKHPPLIMLDGKSFLEIRRYTDKKNYSVFRLNNIGRELYFFIDNPRTLDEIKNKFPSIPIEDLNKILDSLLDNKLIFTDGNNYLALAVLDLMLYRTGGEIQLSD